MCGDAVVNRPGLPYRLILESNASGIGCHALIEGMDTKYQDAMIQYGGIIRACCNRDERLERFCYEDGGERGGSGASTTDDAEVETSVSGLTEPELTSDPPLERYN